MWLALIASLGASISLSSANDWPQWRHDSTRSAAVVEELPAKLSCVWKKQLAVPRSAFSHDPRTEIDRSYEPVAAGGLLYVSSMVNDSVTAFDIRTGATRWVFFTEGPVRLAPAVWQDSLYVGSDDGYLYCLDRKNGTLKWKFRAVPDKRGDYRLLGNERMISRWPVRVAPTVHDGKLYFASGLWPTEGVYVFCLDAASGKQLWVNRENSNIQNGLNDHGRNVDFGLSPNGYGAVCGTTLAVPSGRALNAFHDLETGKREPYTTGYGKSTTSPRGTWNLTSSSNYYFIAGKMFAIDAEKLPAGKPVDWVTKAEFLDLSGVTEAKFNALLARDQYIISVEDGVTNVSVGYGDGTSMLNAKNKITYTTNEQAFVDKHPFLYEDPLQSSREIGIYEDPVFSDGELYVSVASSKDDVVRGRGEYSQRLDEWSRVICRDMANPRWRLTGGPSTIIPQIEFPEKWSIDSPLKIHLKAGSKLYGGALGKVGAIDLPVNGKKNPEASWSASIDGRVHRMIAASGHLVVVTESGGLYVFGAGGKVNATLPAVTEERYESDGIILQYGWNQGRSSQALLESTTKHLIVLEADVEKIKKVRKAYSEKGLYGQQLHLIHDTGEVVLPPYFADRIVASKNVPLDHCRPFGGKIEIFGAGASLVPDRDELDRLGFEQVASDDTVVFQRIRAPEGSDSWTHEEGSASNTGSNLDDLVKPPFAVLWYNGSVDRMFSPEWDYTHYRNPTPLIDQGRMFVIAGNEIHTFDIYTGRHLWTTNVPESEKTLHFRTDHRKSGRPTNRNHLLVGGEYLYFDDHQVFRFDQATGQLLGSLSISDLMAGSKSKPHAWGEVRAFGGDLLCSVGPVLARVDIKSGDVKWAYKTDKYDGFAFVVGGDKLFAIDYLDPERFFKELRRGATKTDAIRNGELRCLNVNTGAELWRKPVPRLDITAEGMENASKSTHALMLLEMVKPILGYNSEHDILLVSPDRQALHAFNGASGETVWSKSSDVNLRVLTILPNLFWAQQSKDNFACDILTGTQQLDLGATKSSCGRYLGNQHIITCRNNTASFLEIESKDQVAVSNVRAGCSNSMLPAGGILNALNSAHGCNCNYPLFCSYAMIHLPESAEFEPMGRIVQKKPKVPKNGAVQKK
jgi:outer membrane protein assembly factor BamB